MPKRTTKFLLYTIHGHVTSGNPNYPDLILRIAEMRGRVWRQGNRVTAFGPVSVKRDQRKMASRVSLITYTGDADRSILFFDLNEQTEINSLLESGRFVARKTHIMLDAGQRTLVIEAGRGHLQAEEFAKMLESWLRQDADYESLELSFTPVAAPTFITKIDEFDRIQSATVSISRPNVDWTDRRDQLAKLADDSSAKAIDTTLRARRNGSISKQRGLIPSLKHWLADEHSSVANAKIKGSLPGSSGLIELRLNDHVETLTITTNTADETGHPRDSELTQRLDNYLDQR